MIFARYDAKGFNIDKTLFPFESRFLTVPSGAKIHYVDEGSGPVLLLLHGNPTWSFLYRKIISELKNNFRCIAPDYPGFGLSQAPNASYGFTPEEHMKTIKELVEALDLEDITLMMQDWGGPIGFGLAQSDPKRYSGFVIGNTFAWPLNSLGQKLFSHTMGGIIGRSLALSCNGIVHFFMRKGVTHRLDDQTYAMYMAPFHSIKSRSPTYIFPRELRRIGGFLSRVENNMVRIATKPALIVWGEKDFAFKTYERNKFEQIFSNHQTILLPDAGHFIQEDSPQQICKAIRSWAQLHQENIT